MAFEPVAFFRELLKSNGSILDFIHSDFAVVNEVLARHYGIQGVSGNHFRRVPIDLNQRRGGVPPVRIGFQQRAGAAQVIIGQRVLVRTEREKVAVPGMQAGHAAFALTDAVEVTYQ